VTLIITPIYRGDGHCITELPLADGSTLFGVGIDKNIVAASLKAVVSGVNRAMKRV
jgi:hypothetical protein